MNREVTASAAEGHDFAALGRDDGRRGEPHASDRTATWPAIGAAGDSPPLPAVVRALRPTQWIKNGVLLAGLVFAGRLFDASAVARAIIAVGCFCLLSSGFYLLNDVRDRVADRLHPVKCRRPVAAEEISPGFAVGLGALLIAAALGVAVLLGTRFLLVALAYGGLMAAYNLALKQVVVLDVLVIAAGFVIRAAAGAIVIDVTISPWLLVCTMLLALLIGFGKRRHELVSLSSAGRHRRNLDVYSRQLLDWCVALAAFGTLLAYAVYTVDAASLPSDRRMAATVPIVAFGVLRYGYLLYRRGEGGSPESMLLADRGLLLAVGIWSLLSAFLLYAR